MWRYAAQRVLASIPSLLAITIIIFVFMRVAPGDVAQYILGSGEGSSKARQEDIQALREKLGLNRPILVQYGDWLLQVAQGNLGESLLTGDSIRAEVLRRLPLTFELAFLTLIISLLLAVPLGVVSAVRQDTWVDQVVRVVSVGGLTMPTFWTATLMILLLAIAFRWMAPLEYLQIWEDPVSNVKQLALPAIALGYYSAAVVARMTRSQMLEVLRQDFVRTARAKGLRERRVLVRHALVNALLPVMTISGIQFAYLLGGTVIMEKLFILPGMGSYLIDAVLSRDYTVVQAVILVFAVIVLIVNIVIDLLYRVVDPRVKL